MRFEEVLYHGDFARLCYRLGSAKATGVLTICPESTGDQVLVLRRGSVLTAGQEGVQRCSMLLSRLAACQQALSTFEGGTDICPPRTSTKQIALAEWSRRHIEKQLDSAGAHRLVQTLAGTRLVLDDQFPLPTELCDETDRRILAAMDHPRRIDQIWPRAKTPRFRLLAFIHFLQTIGAITLEGVAAPAAVPNPGRNHALRILGVQSDADSFTIKRAYRRLARALHPDLNAINRPHERRRLEQELASVTAAYKQLSRELP